MVFNKDDIEVLRSHVHLQLRMLSATEAKALREKYGLGDDLAGAPDTGGDALAALAADLSRRKRFSNRHVA